MLLVSQSRKNQVEDVMWLVPTLTILMGAHAANDTKSAATSNDRLLSPASFEKLMLLIYLSQPL
jgi:hypothetical protein